MKTQTQELRILIADDHALFRRGVRGLLQDQPGWTVVGEAGSGQEAVDQAQKLKPDVAILDVTMPDLDGLEATRQLRQAAPDTKILILTMHESKQMLRRVLEAGASGYVLKSDFPRSLVEAVKNVSRDKRFFSAKVTEIVFDGFLEASDAPRKPRQQNYPSANQPNVRRRLSACWPRARPTKRSPRNSECRREPWRHTGPRSC